MPKIKLYILILGYLYFTNAYSQTSRYWCDLKGLYYNAIFTEDIKLTNGINYFSKVEGGGQAQSVFSSFNGDLMFLAGQYRIYDHTGIPIRNSDKIYIPTESVGLQTSENSWDFLGNYFFDSTSSGYGPYQRMKSTLSYYCVYNNCFDSLKYYPFGLYKTEYKRDSNNIGYISKKMLPVNCSITLNRIKFQDIKRSSDYNYNILGIRAEDLSKTHQNSDVGLFHFSYNKNDFNVLDSFIFNSYDYIPADLKKLVPIYGSRIYLRYAHLSRNRDKIYANVQIEITDNLQHYIKEVFFEINVDPINGKFISVPKVIYETLNATNLNLFKLSDTLVSYNSMDFSSISDAFAPNDSILYLNYSERKVVNGVTIEIIQKIIAWQFRLELLVDAKTVFSKVDYNTENSNFNLLKPNINPFGGLTLVFVDRTNKTNNYCHVKKANKPFSTSLVIQKFPYNNAYLGSFQSPILHNYDFLSIKKDSIIYKDCGAYVNIKNKSDVSNGLSDFKWLISKNKEWTEWDSFSTVDLPTQFYTKSGKYLFKLHGKSNIGSGYNEWYVDTINISIPDKPIANFYAKDSIVCRYTSLKFNNYSFAIDTIKNDYLWSFGDGSTSLANNPLYVYSIPGIYTVSLLYRNGYCDSTLVKNQYIRVVDAPKPGFSVLNNQGCAPFVAQFNDTVKLNVRQKDYWISDSSGWKNISVSQDKFTHIFNKAGVYWAIQRLTGFSGCVIMQDSVKFNISKGLSSADTLNVITGTILNTVGINGYKNIPLLWWPKLDAAIKYQVYKNGSPFKITADTFLYDDYEYIKDIDYSVAGIDSCGKFSAIGRLAKPILLQGQIIGNNEGANLQFSPYRQWQSNNITYKLQKLINNSWQVINSTNANIGYIDEQFLNLNQLESCYRVYAFDNNNPFLITYSNEICIPYLPTIFIPNSFSPNDDGVNDVLDITGFGISNYQIVVYNRWGELVFWGDDKQSWNGQQAADGVYLIRVEYTTNSGLHLRHRGTVTLLK